MPDFGGEEQLTVRAVYLGDRLDLKTWKISKPLASSPLVVEVGSDGCAVLFRYGVMVGFNLSADEESALIDELKPYIKTPFENPESEGTILVRDAKRSEGVEQDQVLVREFSIERLQLVAQVLAKSCVLAYSETAVTEIFDRVEPLAISLKQHGRGGYRNKQLLRQIGDILLMHHRMVGRVEMRDKPDILWEHPDMERLYSHLVNEYEIRERHSALDRKLRLITQTAETLVELLRHRSTLRVEWYIVILIVVEIVLMLLGAE